MSEDSMNEHSKREVEMKELRVLDLDSLQIVKLLFFPSPLNKIVAMIYEEGRILIFDSATYERLNSIDERCKSWSGNGQGQDLVKWGVNSFLSSSSNGVIFHISLKNDKQICYEITKIFRLDPRVYGGLHRILKLDDDYFLCRTSKKGVIMLSYSKSEEKVSEHIRNWDIKSSEASSYLLIWSSLAKSKLFPSSFFISGFDNEVGGHEASNVKLINWKSKYPSVKEFVGFFKVYCISVIVSKFGEEILVTCGSSRNINFFNCGSDPNNPKIGLSRSVKCTSKINASTIYSMSNVANKYLICGGNSLIGLIDLEGENEKGYSLILEKKASVGNIFALGYSCNSSEKRTLRIFAGCGSIDYSLRILEISGLNNLNFDEDENNKKDLEERRNFLLDNFFLGEDYQDFLEHQSTRSNYIHVKFGDFSASGFSISNTFFLL